MPPRYSSVQKVADYLGLEFSGLQAAEAERSLLAAESWLDARTGRTWDGAGPVIEYLTVAGTLVYLDAAPVASVASVEVRRPDPASPWQALPAGSSELADPGRGLLLLRWGYAGWWARVTYTPAAAAVDSRVVRIATLVAAAWMQPTLDATTGGGAGAGPVVSRRLGDVEVRYASSPAAASAATPGGTVPDAVAELVWQLAGPVLA